MAPVLLPQILKESGVEGARLGFVTEQGGKLTWAGYTLTYAQNTVRNLEKAGYKIYISLGGLNGAFPGESDIAPEAIYHKFMQIHKQYPRSSLCFDIEQPHLESNRPQLDKIMAAAVRLQKETAVEIILTLRVLPEGLVPGFGLNVLHAAHDSGLVFKVNIMAMDYGPSYTQKSMGDYGIEAAITTAKQIHQLLRFRKQSFKDVQSMVEITPMIGMNDTAPLVCQMDDMEKMTKWALENNVSLSCWSLTRDHPGKGTMACATHSCLSQTPYQFSKTVRRIVAKERK